MKCESQDNYMYRGREGGREGGGREGNAMSDRPGAAVTVVTMAAAHSSRATVRTASFILIRNN